MRDPLVRSLPCPESFELDYLVREWLVTNGLGGYASGTLSGVNTRRYHGLLISSLPSPSGRVVMLNNLGEQVVFPDGKMIQLSGEEREDAMLQLEGSRCLKEFRLEAGLPVWLYDLDGSLLEKRVFMPYKQNTVHIIYHLISGDHPLQLDLRPAVHFRNHEAPVDSELPANYSLILEDKHIEISAGPDLPKLKMLLIGKEADFKYDVATIRKVIYRREAMRGYNSRGDLWSPGFFRFTILKGEKVTLVASSEDWIAVRALSPHFAAIAERERRIRLLSLASKVRDREGMELVLAADQFIITPSERVEDTICAKALGDEACTVIAGYHWFTDWGRDTMISLEGLTLITGRWREAGWILRTFARYIREGLIPNMFPEGQREGVYHTADATLWYFHAIDRYLEYTRDRSTLRFLLPDLIRIMDMHMRGTRFGIGIDPEDCLLRQGDVRHPLTWMDAHVGDWVVTPRRGKAVEINALWYNALKLMETWVSEELDHEKAQEYRNCAEKVQQSFNNRFWYEKGRYLFDVVDGENGDDVSCRPNQVFSISLRYPVLDRTYWNPVLDTVHKHLLTPFGLRSLAPGFPDYKSRYYGDRRSRDAAYHQGTVWAWLIGPFVDAWLKVHPGDIEGARQFLHGFYPHLDHACIGTYSEVFDGKEPFEPHGCVAQAWSIAELLRSWVKTSVGT
jgi:predicted glycogen debranching enzyme